MGRHAIAEKLAPRLEEQIRSESQVVYIMVELRKLLEHEQLKATYDIVNFYGNWVVHTKLEDSPIADKIVCYFDDLNRIGAGEELAVEQGISRLIGHMPFQSQLRACLAQLCLSTTLSDDAQFGAFCAELGKVIEDCPLFIRRRKPKRDTAFVESVTVETRHDDHARVIFDWVPAFHTQPEFPFAGISMVF
jgi:hypothetical protein